MVNRVKIKIPAKIILFGEHSVVHPSYSVLYTTVDINSYVEAEQIQGE